MNSTSIDGFLDRQRRVSHTSAHWGVGVDLGISGYLTTESPPPELVTSVRAIVLREECVLVMRNPGGHHILPGGRVEMRETFRETFKETLQREVLEEAGVAIRVLSQIGFFHLRHTSPKPEGHPHPYPDFFQPVYVTSFVGFRTQAKVAGDYEISSRFRSLRDIDELELGDHDKVFLAAALTASPHP